MIVSTQIDPDGTVQVTLDSDGDQGQVYAPDVLHDMLKHASLEAVTLYTQLHPKTKTPKTKRPPKD